MEGPGCTRNGDCARRAVGRRVVAISGKKAAAVLAGKAALPAGASLLSCITVGKQLFMTFGNAPDIPHPGDQIGADGAAAVGGGALCLQVHFGMSGSLTLNGDSTKYGTKPDLDITLTAGVGGGAGEDAGGAAGHRSRIRCFGVGLTAVTTATPPRRLAQLGNLDVCSARFDPAAAAVAVRRNGVDGCNRYLADVLLDQGVLPGSGNIIKNEALHLVLRLPRSPNRPQSIPMRHWLACS